MKRIFFLIITLLIFFIQTLCASAEPTKVMSINYDDTGALVFINQILSSDGAQEQFKICKLDNPNRIYFDLENSILIGGKQQLVFEKSNIKEIRLSQFTTNPDVVRAVITFEEDFDTSKVKVLKLDGNVVVKCSSLLLKNDYFNPIYDENPPNLAYSSIVANSQAIQKVPLNVNTQASRSNSVMTDIQKAFEDSTLNNSDGKTYDSVVSVDISSNLKLRTKYFINGYYLKNGGLLVSGLGQVTTNKMFYLDSPKRIVIDLANTFVEKNIRNKELKLCPDGSCKDTAKIGQFEYNKARVVITSDKADKYIPVYSADNQSMLLINSEKLNHTSLANTVSNINKVFVRKIDSKTNELIISFTTPVVHSILRNNNNLNLYFFNVKSYNEQEIIKTLNNTYYNRFTLSLLPQIGVKASLGINKDDNVKIEQSLDGKAIKLIIKQGTKDNIADEKPVVAKKSSTKGKVVLDPGHGGSDYGCIREGINEKDITLDVSQRVASILKSKGYKAVLTRTNDTYVSLEDRVEFSEKETPEIFVSIHVNSAVATEPKGIETHYYHDYSNELAKVVHSHLAKEIDTKDRGLFKSKFYVINHTTVPAILVEMGFLSNEEERAELITEKRKQKTAKAIAEGIIEYCKLQK